MINEVVLKKLNESETDIVLSPYSLNKAMDGAMYVLGMSDRLPDMSTTEGIEEFNSWYSEQDKEKYEAKATDIFGKNKTKVSFSDPQGTADVINNDCNEKTHGMIPHIASPNDFKTPGSNWHIVGIILNTIYLKQAWMYPRTKLDKFSFNDEEVEGMESKDDELGHMMWYNDGPLAGMLFKNGFSFYTYMPKDISKGLSEKDIDFVSNYIKQRHKLVDIRVKMPFIDTTGEMEGTYVDDKTDNRLDFRQKAKIVCDDKGVEAAAATMIRCLSGSSFSPKEPLEIVLDKPFFFFIEKNGKIFFIGKRVGSYLKKERLSREAAEALGFGR